MKKKSCTITCDGSFYPDTKEAGYAFWISSDEGKFTRHGKLKEARNSQEAEIQSLVNSLHFVRNHYKLKYCEIIYVNTDCKMIIDIMDKPHTKLRKKNAQKRMRQLRGFIQKYVGNYNGRKAEVKLRHVYSHKANTDSRQYVNNAVDKMAKIGAKL